MESAIYGKISFPLGRLLLLFLIQMFPLIPKSPRRSGGFRSKCVSPDPSLDKIETEKLFWIWKANPTLRLSKTGGGIGPGLKLCQHSWIQAKKLASIWWHDNRFEVNWPPEPTLVLRWISKFFLFGALPSDTLKIKHTKNLKEIPSRHVLENV